ncbi:MAG: polymer-forming cytoskeletal protein [Proteobacteria bacterium]|nr:polymer-forming cytoskeletal protein [Pseudomonadota bacterium]
MYPVAALILAWAAGPALADDDDAHDRVLGSVHVEAGEHTNKATTVNGSIDIGANAVVKHAETVNGSVTVHENATVDAVETVNGSIDLATGVRVAGKVELVNGKITVGRGTDIGGKLSSVNGEIRLTAAHVGGGIETTNSNLTVGANSRIEGGILYNETSESWFSFFGKPSRPRVIIEPGAVVTGELDFRRAVDLYVSDRANIGTVKGATVHKFSGALVN